MAVAGTAARQQAVGQAQAQGVSAEQAIVSAQAALERSQGMLQSADASKLEVNVRDAQFSTAKATTGQASTALEDAKLQLSYTMIAAPVAGRVARKSVEAGQRLQSGQPLLAVVEDNPWIVANFKETQLENMRPNQPVDIRVDSFPHHHFTATLIASRPVRATSSLSFPQVTPRATSPRLFKESPSRLFWIATR